jgi:hypothetical protein
MAGQRRKEKLAALENRTVSAMSLDSERSPLRNESLSGPEFPSVLPQSALLQGGDDNVEDVAASPSMDFSSMLEFDLEPLDLSMMQSFNSK